MLSPYAHEKLSEELKEPWLQEVLRTLYQLGTKVGIDKTGLLALTETEYRSLNSAVRDGYFLAINTLANDLLRAKAPTPQTPTEFGELKPEPSPSRYEAKATPTV